MKFCGYWVVCCRLGRPALPSTASTLCGTCRCCKHASIAFTHKHNVLCWQWQGRLSKLRGGYQVVVGCYAWPACPLSFTHGYCTGQGTLVCYYGVGLATTGAALCSCCCCRVPARQWSLVWGHVVALPAAIAPAGVIWFEVAAFVMINHGQ